MSLSRPKPLFLVLVAVSLFLILVAVWSVWTGLIFADKVVTNTNGDDSAGSLRKAIADASSGATITFDAELNGEIIRLDGRQLIVDKDLTIDASDLSEGITISGDQSDDGWSTDDSRVFEVRAGFTVLFRSLKIVDGIGSSGIVGVDGGMGGGILNAGSLTLDRCVVSGNQAVLGSFGQKGVRSGKGRDGHDGGGIYNLGTLLLQACSVTSNRAGRGGSGTFGGSSVPGGDGGDSGRGGGIFNAGTATATKCLLLNNRAGQGGRGGVGFEAEDAGDGGLGGDGGGIYNEGVFLLQQSTIVGNRAGAGGSAGGVIRGGQGTNGGNGGDGGGIFNGGELTLQQCTVVRNFAGHGDTGASGGSGGGIAGSSASYVLNLTDTILAENEVGLGTVIGGGADLESDFQTTRFGVNFISNNLLGDRSPSTVFPGSSGPYEPNANGDLVGTHSDPLDPVLGELLDNGGSTRTLLPLRGSPVMNPTGGATEPGNFLTDQRGAGFPRIIDGKQDVGAAEAPDYAAIDAAKEVEAVQPKPGMPD